MRGIEWRTINATWNSCSWVPSPDLEHLICLYPDVFASPPCSFNLRQYLYNCPKLSPLICISSFNPKTQCEHHMSIAPPNLNVSIAPQFSTDLQMNSLSPITTLPIWFIFLLNAFHFPYVYFLHLCMTFLLVPIQYCFLSNDISYTHSSFPVSRLASYPRVLEFFFTQMIHNLIVSGYCWLSTWPLGDNPLGKTKDHLE